ncbi:MAG TPA: molybdenum cofactor guanylyltransferase [Ktedonobacteraceae bacterium]|nr:molybdenum cofactor guanylyltransferase [Ktedonobacteraceae bacterium]
MRFIESPSGIILAGGSSRRMGQDKALLPFPGADPPRTFLEELIRTLDYCCSEVFIVARDQEQASQYAFTDTEIVLDSIPGGGPLVGLASALQAVSTDYAVLVAVDMPFVTPQLLAFMILHYEDGKALVPLVNGHPQVTLAIYPRSILHIIDDLIRQGRRDLRSLLDAAPVRYIDGEELRMVDPALRSFVGVNTPEDLARL